MLCTEHINRGSKAPNESHIYIQNQWNGHFQPVNKPYLRKLAPPTLSVCPESSQSSKSKSSLGSSNASRKELLQAELLADQEKIKAERKLLTLKLQVKKFRLQPELEKATIKFSQNYLWSWQCKKATTVVLTRIKLIVYQDLIAITNEIYSIKIHPQYYIYHKKQILTQSVISKTLLFSITIRQIHFTWKHVFRQV